MYVIVIYWFILIIALGMGVKQLWDAFRRPKTPEQLKREIKERRWAMMREDERASEAKGRAESLRQEFGD
jgi:hypothetical protein